MPRATNSNPTSRSMHTRNNFAKKRSPINKISGGNRGTYQKKHTSVHLRSNSRTRKESSAATVPLFELKKKEDFVVTDMVLQKEGKEHFVVQSFFLD